MFYNPSHEQNHTRQDSCSSTLVSKHNATQYPYAKNVDALLLAQRLFASRSLELQQLFGSAIWIARPRVRPEGPGEEDDMTRK